LPKTPLSRTVAAYAIGGGIPTVFLIGLCYWFYVTTANEPIVTEEAYNRQVILNDVCKGEALTRNPGDPRSQEAYSTACSEKLWPTLVKPYLQYREGAG
jgi:hypothetical protein